MSRAKTSSKTSRSSGSKSAFDFYRLNTSPYLSSGEPYVPFRDISESDSRFGGKQFSTAPTKKGVTNDTTFSPFTTNAVGEPYQARNSPKKKSKSKQISARPFRPSNPCPKMSGSGDRYGLFQTFEYSLNDKKPEDPVAKRRAASPDGRSLPNFYTSPGAPGGASYPYGAIGGTRLDYMPEPYGGDRKKVEAMRSSIPDIPFKSMSTMRDAFDKSVFSPQPTLPTRKKRVDNLSKTQPLPRAPFRPSSPARSGVFGTINPFPEYIVGADQPKVIKKQHFESTRNLSKTRPQTSPELVRSSTSPTNKRQATTARDPISTPASSKQSSSPTSSPDTSS